MLLISLRNYRAPDEAINIYRGDKLFKLGQSYRRQTNLDIYHA
jgi:hypothetical protein